MRQRGCNGLSYVLEYVSKKTPMDEEVVQDGREFSKYILNILSIHLEHLQICSESAACNLGTDCWIQDFNANFLYLCAGVRVLIDQKAQLTLLGTEMDYQESKLASEFVFNNPNIKGTCGCGESFTI